jgi:hypothetical protein
VSARRLTAAERDDYEERAAIMEHDGGLSRAEAERQALARVLAARAPKGATGPRPHRPGDQP